MLIVALLAVPVLLTSYVVPAAAPVFVALAIALALGTCGPTTLYVTSQRALREDWKRRLTSLPVLMLIGTGIAVSNSRAVLEALMGVHTPFVRTPKRSLTDSRLSGVMGFGYRPPLDVLFVLEAALAVYSAWGVSLYFQRESYLIGPFLALYACSFGCVALLSLRDNLRLLGRDRRPAGHPSLSKPVT
jgi:hypothetical protein